MDIKSSYLTEDQIADILKSAQDAITNDIVQSATDEVKHRIQWTLEAQVAADVTAWYKEEVSPEIRTALTTNKDMIVATAVSFAEVLASELAKSYTNHITEVMADSWKRNKVFKALFD